MGTLLADFMGPQECIIILHYLQHHITKSIK